MSSFTKPLTVTQIGHRKWRLEEGFDYYVGDKDSDDIISVPAGYVSDGSSVPKIFWSLVGSPMGSTAQSGFLHDFLYGERKRTRKECDGIFVQAMFVLGVPWWKRRVMWAALRLFGWVAWNNKATSKSPAS